MVGRVADTRAERPDPPPEGRTRNVREYGVDDTSAGVTSATAPREPFRLRASHLMEAVVERENMARAYRRVLRNGGAPGVDAMSVEELLPHLRQHWPSIKEHLLEGRYLGLGKSSFRQVLPSAVLRENYGLASARIRSNCSSSGRFNIAGSSGRRWARSSRMSFNRANRPSKSGKREG